jgi:malate/lactate dehydrogenase
MLKDIVEEIACHNPHILLVASNPVDVLTYAVWRIGRYPPCQFLFERDD